MDKRKYIVINKPLGKTPLEALEEYRNKMISNSSDQRWWRKVPMTYAGRLDPMATGLLPILIGDECKNKEKYLNKDKEYEVEILFGISSDSYDILGIPNLNKNIERFKDKETLLASIENIKLQKYQKRFMQSYPAYSSRTVKGKQLHALARKNNLPDDMPCKKVEIYSIKRIGKIRNIDSYRLLKQINKSVRLVNGDFRQQIILGEWHSLLSKSNLKFPIMRIRVKCSAGTYMRSLANTIGNYSGLSALALSIKRTRISKI